MEELTGETTSNHLDLARKYLQDAFAAFVKGTLAGEVERRRATEGASIRPDRPVLKGALSVEKGHANYFIPIIKAVEFEDPESGEPSLMVEGCASVADFVDDQGDVPTVVAIKTAMEEWEPFGNVRYQHNPTKPIGTIHPPVIGGLPAGIKPPGWWMGTHPETGTQAAFLRVHVVGDKQAIGNIKAGIVKGFSIGGAVTASRLAIVEVDERGVVQHVIEYRDAA